MSVLKIKKDNGSWEEISGFASNSDNKLPTVTIDNNDNVLQVVNGEWKVLSLENSTIANYIDEYIADALGGSY